MIETNISIVRPGRDLYIWIRYADVKGTDIAPDLLQRACGTLRHKHGLAAIPCPGNDRLLVIASKNPIQSQRIEERDWALDISDAGKPSRKLDLQNPEHKDTIATLVERALEANLSRRTNLWTLESPSIWYEAEPEIEERGISVYRRYELGSVFIDGEGLGIKVDVATAFFSTNSLSYYFDSNETIDTQQRREQDFIRLTNRQKGQKGTLLYNNGRHKLSCYFELAPQGITCKTTGEIRIKGTSYASLAEYYRSEFPHLKFDENGRAIRVSFRQSGRSGNNPDSVWIAAELARIRVMNDHVPERLSNLDKISPQLRRQKLKKFWKALGRTPFGNVAPGIKDLFWRPGKKHLRQFSIPALKFGNNKALEPPVRPDERAYKNHYRKRIEYLNRYGCYDTPPTMTRDLHFAYPTHADGEIVSQLASDLTDTLSRWTGRPLNMVDPIPFETISEATSALVEDKAKLVVFILNNESHAYHEAAYQKPWRIKRVTQDVLDKHRADFIDGAWDKRKKCRDKTLGKKRWDSFVQMNALSILQLLDAVPYIASSCGKYEAQLAIDVGHNKRHFAISLMLGPNDERDRPFAIRTDFQIVTGQKSDEINPVLLRDQIVETFQQILGRQADPISSLLVNRDGKLWPSEVKSTEEAIKILKGLSIIKEDATIHMVNLSKNVNKLIRLWDFRGEDHVVNVLEGTALICNKDMAVFTSTGESTLNQGTARPLTLSRESSHGPDIAEAANASFLGSQHNWSSPKVAQQLPLYFKKTDDELKTRDAQEIRRLN